MNIYNNTDMIKSMSLIGLIILSSFVVFFKYSIIPANVSYDEVEFAKLALSLDGKEYSVYSSLASGHSTLYFYILLFSIKIFGISSFALRLPAAIFGVVNVVLIYLIFRNLFKKHITILLSVFIFLSMRWYFNFARFSFEATFLLFLELASIYYMFRFIDKAYKKRIDYISLAVSALFAGLAFHSYYPGRLFFILPTIWLFLQTQKKYAVIFVAIVSIIAAPLLIHNFQNPDIRVSQISFLSDPQIPAGMKVNGILKNISSTILMPFWHGDMNGRHNFPGKAGLNPILALLFLIGLIYAFTQKNLIQKPFNLHTFFLGYIIISIIPTLLTSPSDNPNMLRTFTIIPALVYFMAVAIQYLLTKKNLLLYSKFVVPALCLLILISTAYELRTYFLFQSRVFNNSFEVICDLKDVVNKPIVPKECRVQKNMF